MLTATRHPRSDIYLCWPDAHSTPNLALNQGTVTSLLDVVDYGVLITAPDGRLLFANRAAHEWLAAENPLRVRHGVVTAGASDDTTAVSEAIRNASNRRLQTLLSFDQAVGDQGCVSIVPLAASGETPLVLLMLSRRHDSQTLSQEAYARRLCLTTAQTRVLKLLCAGTKPSEIARRLAVKLTTVRSHISAIRDKTGVHDTASIVHQVARLPPLPSLLRDSRLI